MKVVNKQFIGLAVMAIVAFFVCNSALPTDIMEIRNLVTAQEMVSDGHILVPTMNGDLRLEKPPLPTWVAAAIEYVAPHSLGAQRMAAGVMAVVWSVFLYLFAFTLSKQRHFAGITVMVFLSSYQVVLMGRTATWDIYCHAFMMGAIYWLYRGLADEPDRRWKWFPLAGLMMGLSFMSKGPVSFYALLLPMLIALIPIGSLSIQGKRDALAAMIVICVVVGGWWYAYLGMFEPKAVAQVLHKESSAWANHNIRPWYYYWRFFLELGAWAVFTFATLFVYHWKRRMANPRPYLFSVVWMIASLVLLSLLPEKKIRYLLPMMAPCAMCVAALLIHLHHNTDKWSRLLVGLTAATVALAAVAIPVVLHVYGLISTVRMLCMLPFLAGLAVWIVMSARQMNTYRIAAGVAGIFVVIESFMLGAVGRLFGNPDMHSINATRQMAALRDMPMFHPQEQQLRIELVYEAQRKIRPIDLHSSDSVKAHLPFILVSNKPVSQLLSEQLLSQVDTTYIDTYDDNKHPKSNKLYTDIFINRVTVISQKK